MNNEELVKFFYNKIVFILYDMYSDDSNFRIGEVRYSLKKLSNLSIFEITLVMSVLIKTDFSNVDKTVVSLYLYELSCITPIIVDLDIKGTEKEEYKKLRLFMSKFN